MKKVHSRLITLFLLIMSFTLIPSFADDNISEYKLALIETLLKQTHQSKNDISEQLTDSYQKQITTILKRSYPNISSTTLIKINDAVAAGVNQQLIEQQQFIQAISPIYDLAFTLEELQAIIAFNETEFGKKLLIMIPLINEHHSDVYDELSLDLAPDINARVLEIIASENKP